MNKKIKSGIYCIENLITGMLYIGSAINLFRRKSEHFSDLKSNKHENNHLQNSYNKYGKENFTFYIVEYVENLENLTEREQSWLDFYRQGAWHLTYNILEIAGSSLGYKHTEETKKRMSENHADYTGEKHPMYGVKGKDHPMYGYKHTKQARQKISQANKNKILTKESRLKISQANTGNFHSEETKRKMSESKMGDDNPFHGKTHTLEIKRFLSERQLGEKNHRYGITPSAETIEKIVAKTSKPILQIDINSNKIIKHWKSAAEIERCLGYNHSLIARVCKGKSKTAYGYKWRYDDTVSYN